MSTTATKPPRSPAPPGSGIAPRRWTREEYGRAADLGLFRPEERLELLDGEILQKRTQKPPHAHAILRTARALAAAFGSGHHVRPRLPLILNGESEPEPDLLVVVGTEDDYATSHPKAADARLVVEVADTSLRFDRSRKGSAYARAGIPEYWIIDLRRRRLECYLDPTGGRYLTISVHIAEEFVTPLAAPHAPVQVTDLLPPR